MVSSEVVMASESGCPIEIHDIEIEKCDDMFDSECQGGKSIPFHRAAYDRQTGQSPNSPREQVTCFLYIAKISPFYINLTKKKYKFIFEI